MSNWNVALARFTGSWISTEFFEALPSPFPAIVFGTPVWKVIISIVLLAAVVLLTLFWRSFAKRQQKGTSALARYTWALSVPLVFSSLIGLSSFFARTQLNTSGPFGEFLQAFVILSLYLAAAWSIWLLCFVVAELIISLPKISERGYDAHLLRLIARVVSLASAAVIILIGADAVGVPALGIIASLGVGGVAVALAAQASVENLFGGFSFFTDRPFRVGDFVKFSDNLGTVEMIGPRSTRIRGLDNSVTTVPNAQLAKLNITNYQMRRKYLFRHKIGLELNTSRTQLYAFRGAVETKLSEHPHVEKSREFPRATITALGAYAIEFDVWAYVRVSHFHEFLLVQDQLLMTILAVVEDSQTKLAFPSQTIFISK